MLIMHVFFHCQMKILVVTCMVKKIFKMLQKHMDPNILQKLFKLS